MMDFILKMRNSKKLKIIIYISLCVLLGAYFFSIPSFSNRNPWKYITYASLILLTGATFVYIFLYDKFKFDRKIIIPFVFVVDAFICTMIYTPSNWRDWISVLLLAISFVVIFYSCKCINKQKLILKILLIAFLAFGFYYAIIPEHRMKIFTFSLSMKDRLGYFDNVNLIASYFAIGFGISLYLGLIHNNKLDYLYLLACLPFMYLGLFTGSRAYIFLLAIFFISIAYLKFKNRKIIYFSVLGAFVVLLVFLVIFVPTMREQFDKTLYTIFGIGEPDPKKIETSAIQRVLWMKYGFVLGSKNLIIGFGCDGFNVHSGIGTYAHNNFAEVLCDFGLPGFIFFYFMILYAFALHFVSKKECSNFAVPFAFYYIVKSMFGVFYDYKDFYILLGVCYFFIDDVSFADLSNSIARRFKKENEATVYI